MKKIILSAAFALAATAPVLADAGSANIERNPERQVSVAAQSWRPIAREFVLRDRTPVPAPRSERFETLMPFTTF
jgi:hypothetical protein